MLRLTDGEKRSLKELREFLDSLIADMYKEYATRSQAWWDSAAGSTATDAIGEVEDVRDDVKKLEKRYARRRSEPTR